MLTMCGAFGGDAAHRSGGGRWLSEELAGFQCHRECVEDPPRPPVRDHARGVGRPSRLRGSSCGRCAVDESSQEGPTSVFVDQSERTVSRLLVAQASWRAHCVVGIFPIFSPFFFTNAHVLLASWLSKLLRPCPTKWIYIACAHTDRPALNYSDLQASQCILHDTRMMCYACCRPADLKVGSFQIFIDPAIYKLGFAKSHRPTPRFKSWDFQIPSKM